MRAVLSGVGTRGDFQPLLALALALKHRGHEAVLYGARNFEPWAAREGIAFEGSDLDIEAAMQTVAPGPRKTRDTIGKALRTLRSELDCQFERLSSLAMNSDVVLGSGACLAGRSAAELAGVPFHMVLYTPQLLPSAEYPPPMPIYDGLSWLNRWGHRAMEQVMRFAYGRHLNELRTSHGLPSRRDILDVLMGSEDVLLATDREYAGAPMDAPRRCVQLASFVYSDPGQLSPELEAFLNAGDKPMYLGFGSMADQERNATRDMVERIAQQLGIRAVLVQQALPHDVKPTESSQRVFVTSSAPHSLLLPRVSVVIHHGGSGTTAAAARAGVPQILVPHFFDQFFFAERLRRYGVAPTPVPRWRLGAKRLKAAIQHVLREPSYRIAALGLARSVRTHNGVELALHYLEERYGARSTRVYAAE